MESAKISTLSASLSLIADLLEGRFGLDALWVFGSEAQGTAGIESDLDLAALFRRAPTATELLDARLEIAASLSRDVDLVDLDRASPILVMQVLRHGRLVLDHEPAHRHRLLASAPGRYE